MEEDDLDEADLVEEVDLVDDEVSLAVEEQGTNGVVSIK